MSFWTEDPMRVVRLRQLWNEGHSASVIADMLGDACTRNQVIGKSHRLGLQARPDPIRHQKVYAQARAAQAPAEVVQEAIREAEAEEQEAVILERRGCEWPSGTGPYTFCGAKRVGHKPYCAAHCKKAYRRVVLTPEEARIRSERIKANNKAARTNSFLFGG